MCIELKITYACGHYEKQLTRCPSFQKKKSSLRNKFFGYYEGMKDCGAVRRERPTSRRNCEKCSVRIDGLVSQRVGDGANLVHRPFVDESFRQEHLDAARESLKKARKGALKPKGHGHQATISTKGSVWVPDHYHHPRTVSATATYGRASAPAPPVAPPRAPSRAGRSRSFSQGRSFASQLTSGKSTNDGARGSSRSTRKPAKPLPTWKAQSVRHTGRLPQRDLGRRSSTSAASRQPPRPMFETYLQAQRELESLREVKRLNSLKQCPLPRMSQEMPHVDSSTLARVPPKQMTKKTWFSALGLGSSHRAGGDADSDVSFACEAARRIEARALRR